MMQLGEARVQDVQKIHNSNIFQSILELRPNRAEPSIETERPPSTGNAEALRMTATCGMAAATKLRRRQTRVQAKRRITGLAEERRGEQQVHRPGVGWGFYPHEGPKRSQTGEWRAA
nr:uncharacterized protein LOC108070502 [Drosophila kikkawai]